MKRHPQLRHRILRRRENGYVLLLLLLIIAMIIFAAAVIVPSITFEIKRDREEEMIHRGAQYARAIRAYYRKYQRYPTKIEDLESTNNLRFLRKRYKDPITGQEFKLLHFGDVKLSFGGIGGGSIPGASAIGGASGVNGPGGFGQNSGFGQSSFGQSSFGQSSFGQSSFGQSNRFGGSTGSSSDSSAQGTPAGGQNGTDPTQGVGGNGPNNSTNGNNGNPGSNSPGGNSASSDPLTGKIIGGPIVGVASASKDQTIREFNHKRKYNEWQFIYDPTSDRGGIITGPYQPPTIGFGQNMPNVNGPGGVQNGNMNSNGSSPGFGGGPGNLPAGVPTNPPPNGGGYSMPNPPSSPPEQ